MHYVVLYPTNGDRIVIIDSVTSFHPSIGKNQIGENSVFVPTFTAMTSLSYHTWTVQRFVLYTKVSAQWLSMTDLQQVKKNSQDLQRSTNHIEKAEISLGLKFSYKFLNGSRP